MGIETFSVTFFHAGQTYSFDAGSIRRDLTDGAGNPILCAAVRDGDGREGVCNLSPDWRIISLYMNMK